MSEIKEQKLLNKPVKQANNIWIKSKNTLQLIYIKSLNNGVMKDVSIKHSIYDTDIYASEVISDSKNNMWHMKNGCIVTSEKSEVFNEKSINAPVHEKDLSIFSISPDKCNIYELIRLIFYKNSYATNSFIFMIKLNKILATGIVFLLFSMVAAIVCLPLNRYKTKTFVSSSIILYSILFMLITNICESMGNNGTLSPIMCVWIPILIAFLLAIATLIWKEE